MKKIHTTHGNKGVFNTPQQTPKILLIIAILIILVQTSFADIIYLKNGNEVKDATIVKIDVDKVEYKIGTRDVLYTAKKSDIAIIFYADGTKETFTDDGSSKSESPLIVNVNQNNNQNVNQNVNVGAVPVVVKEPPPTRCGFTAGERWGTWFLNFIPGLGSVAVMDDWTGAYIQWGIVGGGGLLGILTAYGTKDTFWFGGGIAYAYMINIIYDTYRSYSYCKPGSVSCKPNEGFNLAVIPNRHSNLMPALTYNRAF